MVRDVRNVSAKYMKAIAFYGAILSGRLCRGVEKPSCQRFDEQIGESVGKFVTSAAGSDKCPALLQRRSTIFGTTSRMRTFVVARRRWVAAFQ